MKDSTAQLPWWKKVLFSALATILFFVAVEIVMSLVGMSTLYVAEDPFVGFAENSPLFVEQTQPDGTIVLTTSEKRLNAFNLQRFPKEKKKHTYRIFCMGGSTTYGHPYGDSTSFCGWLREFLRAADPAVNWEVINAGGISYASYRVVNLMREFSRYQPDMFIIYSGQNEFLEERTYRGIRKIPDWLMKTQVLLSKTRTYTLMHRGFSVIRGQKSEGSRETLSGEEAAVLNTIGPSFYRRDDATRENVLKHYRYNLERMAAVARNAGSRIMFVAPASNMKDMPPFKSVQRAGLSDAETAAWASQYNTGSMLQSRGRLADALSSFSRALKIDDQHADLCYRTGQVYFGLRQYDQAKACFQKAIDNDIVPLRILKPMSDDVRATAHQQGVPYIDFVRLLEDDCQRRYGHRLLGDEYFLDHVHPTIEGNRMLGLALLEQMKMSGELQPASAWGEAAINQVTGRVLGRIDDRQRVHALMVTGNTYTWAGQFEKARDALLQASRLERDEKELVIIYDGLAKAASRMNRIDEAIGYCRAALEYSSEYANIHSNLAAMLLSQGKLDDARKHFKEVVRIVEFSKTSGKPLQGLDRLDPNDLLVYALENLATILVEQGKVEEAVSQFAKLLAIRPDDGEAHAAIAGLLAQLGRNREADIHRALSAQRSAKGK